jgi:hypothetical protein
MTRMVHPAAPMRRILHLDLAASYARLEAWIQASNEKHRGDSARRLTGNHRTLAEKIINKYRTFWMAYQAEHLDADVQRLPAIDFNNVFLGKCIGKSPRTVRRLRARMVEVGLIVWEKWHGSRSQFELLLNPEILVFKDQQGRLSPAGWVALQAFAKKDMRTKCPPTKTSTLTSTTRTTSTGMADNLSAGMDSPPSGDEVGNEQAPASTVGKHEENSAKPSGQARASTKKSCAKKARSVAPRPAPIDENRAKHRRQAASALWVQARQMLWGKRYLSQHIQEEALLQIERLFGDRPVSSFVRIVQHYYHRLKLAKLYYLAEHDLDRFPHPAAFFNPDNSTGFRDTRRMADDPQRYPVDAVTQMHRLGRVFRQRDRRYLQRQTGTEPVNIRELF